MDEQTINNLTAAFAAAPSAELAKIIVFALIENNKIEAAVAYVSSLENNLSSDELRRLAKVSAYDGGRVALMTFSEALNSENVIVLVESLIDANQRDSAKAIYLAACERNPSVKNERLNAEFEVEHAPVKLKVIESPDFGDVTDLTRYREQSSSFADVVGLQKIKKQIHKKIILPFKEPSLYQRFRKKIGGGVLLYGPPGCGKTLLARATAGECNAQFFNVEVSDILDMYIGESEQKLHAIFEKARSETPSILFFDELEALAGKREHARNSTSANTVSQFLTELDGFSQNNSGVLVLASTNVPWAIDSAFLRPGRFDRMFFVPPPDKEAREGILEHHTKDRPTNGQIDFKLIANKTSGYSGADLENLIEMAADEAITRKSSHDNRMAHNRS